MNAEELKMILDSISSVSSDASRALIWWMLLHYGTTIVGYVISGGVTLLVLRAFARALSEVWR